MEEAVRDAIGDCPVCLEPMLDPPIHQCQATHPLCYSCWKKVYKGGQGKCPTCRGKLTDKRNLVAEKFLEKLEKKKCKFDACNFRRNSLVLVTDHEKNCIHKTFKCRWSEHRCNFESSTKAFTREHEDKCCEHYLSQNFESKCHHKEYSNVLW